MTTPRRVAVVGNSVAAMLSAITLAEQGWHVTLVTPTPRLGAHFAGLELAGHSFDAGMVFLEFTSYNADASAELSTYDAGRRNDVGRFMPHVERTLARYGEWRSVETPSMLVNGQVLPDVIIANQLSALRALSSDVQARMVRELESLCTSPPGPLHASHKTSDPAFAAHDFETVSLANHGATFHRLFVEPLCRKLSGVATRSFVARYHRMAWLPLYYPETLLAALRGAPARLPDTIFSYPTTGSVAALVRQIADTVRGIPTVNIVQGRIDTLSHDHGHRFTLGLAVGDTFTTDRLVWGSDPETLLRLAGGTVEGTMDRTSLTVACALVRSTDVALACSTMFVPDDDALPFRVTNQSVAAGESAPLSRICCEWNSAFLKSDESRTVDRVRDALVALGVARCRESIVDARVDEFRGALLLPTAANVSIAAARNRRVSELLPTVPCVGPAAPFGATSLNDQIIQGLKVAHELGDPT